MKIFVSWITELINYLLLLTISEELEEKCLNDIQLDIIPNVWSK